MTLNNLFPNISLEDDKNEFKGIIEEGKKADGTSKEDKWLKTLVGFANSNGGSLFIGVEDKTHKIVSLDHLMADKVIQMIHRLIKQKIVPSLKYEIQTIPITQKDNTTRYLLIIKVNRGDNLPVGLKTYGVIAYYIRHFGITKVCSQEELRNLFLYDNGTPYDSLMTDIIYEPKDFSKLNSKYYEITNHKLSNKTLLSIGFIDKQNHLSNGALMFKDDYHNEKSLVVATKWSGINKGTDIVLSSETFSGNLIDEADFCMSFIETRSNNGYKKLPVGRENYFSYPKRAVFEGVINALCHRNYWINNSQIEINIFTDRLEIISPGSLVSGEVLNRETKIAGILPERRNEVICNVFALINYLEKRGSGFDKISSEYSHYDKKYEPYISSNNTYFSLVLPDLTYSGVVDAQSEIKIYVDGVLKGKYDEAILTMCYLSEKSTTEIAKKLNIKPTTYFRKKILDPLVEGGYLLSNYSRPEKFVANRNKVFLK